MEQEQYVVRQISTGKGGIACSEKAGKTKVLFLKKDLSVMKTPRWISNQDLAKVPPVELTSHALRAYVRGEHSCAELLAQSCVWDNIVWPDFDCITPGDISALLEKISGSSPSQEVLEKESLVFSHLLGEAFQGEFLQWMTDRANDGKNIIVPADSTELLDVLIYEIKKAAFLASPGDVPAKILPQADDVHRAVWIMSQGGNLSGTCTLLCCRHAMPLLRANNYALLSDKEWMPFYTASVQFLYNHNDPLGLNEVAYAPYEDKCPLAGDWSASYDALIKLYELDKTRWDYANTLGYICYYGRNTDSNPNYKEARKWFSIGAAAGCFESMYKLGDMLAKGLGGKKDEQKAMSLYTAVYVETMDRFENGERDGKFADAAIRIGNAFRDGLVSPPLPELAMEFYMQAAFALRLRESYNETGDKSVKKRLIQSISSTAAQLPPVNDDTVFGIHVGKVAMPLLMHNYRVTFSVEVNDEGDMRMIFRRIAKEEQLEPGTIVWSIAPARWCATLRYVTLYGHDTRYIWLKNPGKDVECDSYDYDEENEKHCFYLDGEPVCTLTGGFYFINIEDLQDPMCAIEEPLHLETIEP